MPSPRYWREIPGRYRLEGSRCGHCGHTVVPARRVCPRCRNTAMEAVRLSDHARVVTCTVVHVPPDEFVSESPYALAVVETDEGARLLAQVVDGDGDEVRPGLPVRLEFRRIRREGHGGILCYGHKAVPERS
jgi:uncharacterized OB-fold protein